MRCIPFQAVLSELCAMLRCLFPFNHLFLLTSVTKPAYAILVTSNGMGVFFIFSGDILGSFITLALTWFLCAFDLYRIHENTIASPFFGLANCINVLIFMPP